MAFDPSALTLAVDSIAGGSLRIHFYETTDSEAVVTGAGYFSGATARGLREGEAIVVYNSDVGDTYVVNVTSVDGNGAATVEMESYELRKMTDAALAAYTGKSGEVTVNITDDTIHVHDGSTAGGFKLQHKIKVQTGAAAAVYTGSSGEITVNTTDDTIHVHDGSTAGGVKLQHEILKKTSAETAAFTGDDGQLTINTDDDTIHVHDGSTAGGVALALRSSVVVARVTSRTDLKALHTGRYSVAFLDDGNRSGTFHRADYADYTALVAADTHNIIAARSTHDTDYVWLRVGAKTDGSELHVDWARDNPDVVHAATGVPGIAYAYKRCVDLGTALGVCGALNTPGCLIQLPPGESAWEGRAGAHTPPEITSNITLRGYKGSTRLKATSVYGITAMLRTQAISATPGDYVYENIRIEDIIWDSTDRPFVYWLSKADGTPVNDPEADYVMGTGALASGISGVSLTAVLTSGKVTGITINNGGAGWKGHPTYPYQSNQVRLKFTGGGAFKRPASAVGNLSGDPLTITSVTIEDGGLGYVSAPTVTTAGGYADIDLLLDPAVDRRNALGYTQTADVCLNLVQIEDLEITGCEFINTSRTIAAQGILHGRIMHNKFVNCGKPDGTFQCIRQGDYTVPGGARSDDIRIEHNVALDCRRFFCVMAQSGHGVLAHNYVEGGALFSTSVAGEWGGKTVVEGNYVKDVSYVTYTAQMAESVADFNLDIINNTFDGCDGQALGIYAGKSVLLSRNTYRNMYREAPDSQPQFTPETERKTEGYGGVPKIYTRANGNLPSVMVLGNNPDAAASGNGGQENWIIENETIYDDRSAADEPPAVFRWFRVGASSEDIAKNISISKIRRLSPTTYQVNQAIEMFHPDSVPVGNEVMGPRMSLRLYDNFDHASSSSVFLNPTLDTVQDYTFTVGFPPKRVKIVATGNAGQGRMCESEIGWDWSKVTGASVLGQAISHGEAAGTQYFAVFTNAAIKVFDGATAATVFEATFKEWTVDGFILTVTKADQAVVANCLCYP